jgi:hypothetical protein
MVKTIGFSHMGSGHSAERFLRIRCREFTIDTASIDPGSLTRNWHTIYFY